MEPYGQMRTTRLDLLCAFLSVRRASLDIGIQPLAQVRLPVFLGVDIHHRQTSVPAGAGVNGPDIA